MSRVSKWVCMGEFGLEEQQEGRREQSDHSQWCGGGEIKTPRSVAVGYMHHYAAAPWLLA